MLSRRVVIVTGGARGIGRAHCLELARHGATVIVNDVAPERAAVVDEIVAHGGLAIGDGTSVRDFDAVGSMISNVVERHGRLDAVVNNAAILHNSVITKATEREWNDVFAVNLFGTVAVIHHAAVHWRARWKTGDQVTARIVNTVSGAGLFGSFGQASYSASKAAIANLTATAALELGHYGVTVNAISPTARTAMTRGLASLPEAPDDGSWDAFDPSNSSPLVSWLVSERSHWLTGALLRVRGNTVLRIRPWSIDVESAYTARNAERVTVDELDDAMRQLFDAAPADELDGW